MQFGLITEGPTDQVIISNLLYGYFNNPDILINPLQPKTKQEAAGWTKVFSYCQSEEFKGAFNRNDYVLIQIDTDTSHDWGYNTAQIGDDEERIPELLENVMGIFQTLIGNEFFSTHKDKIIFAIAIHSVECWLLPFYAAQKAHTGKLINCLGTLNQYVNRKHGFTVDPNRKGYGNFGYYENVSADLKNNRILNSHYKRNPSLRIFLENLPSTS